MSLLESLTPDTRRSCIGIVVVGDCLFEHVGSGGGGVDTGPKE